MRRRRRATRPQALPILAALLLAAALLGGCERRAQDPPAADAPAASLVATADFGAERLLAERVEPGRSVMRALRGATRVDTAHGGGFVAGMLGRESDAEGRRDWFFFVNGAAPPVGAEDVRLEDGDAVWWDHRAWGALAFVPAVVGSWPAPFARGGRPGPGPVAADPPLRDALAQAGARIAEGDSPWRVRVGAHEDLVARDPAWRRAAADPDGAGLTVSVDGGRIVALDGESGRREPVPGARALIAAVPTGEDPREGILVVVAGLDAAASRAAAERLADDPALVRDAYALALDGAGEPLRAGGRPGG